MLVQTYTISSICHLEKEIGNTAVRYCRIIVEVRNVSFQGRHVDTIHSTLQRHSTSDQLFLFVVPVGSSQRSGFDSRQGQRIFPLASVSRPALGPTQPPVQWVPGVLSPGVKRGRGVTLTIYSPLVPRSRMSRSYTSYPPKRFHGV
jgi:hypothetical protein